MKQVILHLDGDAFFASVEQALDPALKGRPVMTGAERGIVSAFSYEAKARGIHRGMQTWKAKEICPELIVRSSDYRTYQIFSKRATHIMRRHVPVVQEYGVDECFAAIPGGTLADGEKAARIIQQEIQRELGVGYSIGVAPTKSLAKVGSKWNKPFGVTVVTEELRAEILPQIPVGKLWGIGRRMAPWLMARGINTAHELAVQDAGWAARNLAKPYLAMWAELQGIPATSLHEDAREQRGSVQHTRTFRPVSRDKAVVWSELVHNVEGACAKLRGEHILARGFSIHLKTQEFTYRRAAGPLPRPTAFPEDVIAAIKPHFERIFRAGIDYRATGIALWQTSDEVPNQHRLFGADSPADPELAKLYEAVDAINVHGQKIRLGTSKQTIARERIFRLPLLGGTAK